MNSPQNKNNATISKRSKRNIVTWKEISIIVALLVDMQEMKGLSYCTSICVCSLFFNFA